MITRHSQGRVTRQAHVDIPEGTVEEEYAREGFFGRTTHIYRTHPPVDWTHIDGDLRPQAFHTGELAGLGGDWLGGRVTFLENDDVKLSMAHLDQPMRYCFRNADADELLFFHQGVARIETDFGVIQCKRGDYLVIPRGTVYRVDPIEPVRALVVASRGPVTIPDRGIVGHHALFDLNVLEVPTLEPLPEFDRPWQLKVVRAGKVSTITYPHHPITTAGWRGDLTVWKLSIDDIRPMLSERYHLPPSAHVTWMMNNVMVCTFLPRPLETGDPGALKVPFFHANIDYDEVLFYHDGDFFSREGIDAGMVTFHPQGIHHGPQPAAVSRAKDKTRTNEAAVMVDTRNPLRLTEAAKTAAIADYWKSWQG